MIEGILWLVFVLGCLLVCTVILLQEGKGGGLGEAFGGVGQQAFGVKAAGIQKFTTYAIVAVVLAAIIITKIRTGESVVEFVDVSQQPPAVDAGAPAEDVPPPAGGGDGR